MSQQTWEKAIREEWRARDAEKLPNHSRRHPLMARTFDEEEVVEMMRVILSGQLTMSSKVKEFEVAFARY